MAHQENKLEMSTQLSVGSDTNIITVFGIFLIFLKTGALSFGGWSTTVVLLEKELAKQPSATAKVDLKSAASYAQVLPGATQVAIVSNVVYQLRGALGASIATISYLLPAIGLITAFAWLYFSRLHQPDVLRHLQGLLPGLAGVILANAYRIGSKHVSHPALWAAVVAACVLLLVLHIHALIILLGFAFVALGLSLWRQRERT